MRKHGALLFVLIIASVFRLVWLDSIPSGFDMDEVQVGYNAYSILKTLRDENGRLLPVHTSFFNESRPMLSMYLTAASIAVFDLSVFAVRVTGAALGVTSVFLTYLLVKLLFQNYKLSLLVSGLLAISPWHVILTRSTADGAIGLTFMLLSSVWLVLWISKGKAKFLFLIYLSWVMTFFAYIGARPIIFLHAVFWIIALAATGDRKKAGTLTILVLIFAILPTYLTVRSGEGLARYQQIGNITWKAAEARLAVPFLEDGQTRFPLLATRLFHNKLENSLREFLREYTKYVNGNFLFIQGGFPIRYVIPEQSLEYWFEVPFFLIGLFTLLRRPSRSGIFAIFWFMAGALPAALTTEDSPNLQRSVFMLPGLQIITVIGAAALANAIRKRSIVMKRLLAAGFLILGSWEVGRFVHQSVIHQPIHEPWHRNVQFPQIVAYVTEVEKNYNKVVISKSGTEPYLYFLFFGKVDPTVGQQMVIGKRDVEGDWDFGDKVKFSREACPLNDTTPPESGTLYGNVGECAPVSETEITREILRPDNTVAMRFVKKKE